MLALVLAGGRGLRLAPYTQVLPKPLLPVGDRPVLAILLERLRLSGVTHAYIALGYLGEFIQTYFGDGRRAGLNLSYLDEEEPLGTAGPITLLPPQDQPFLVVNGDILTDLPFDELFQFHVCQGAAATVAAQEYRFRLEYGLLQAEGTDLVRVEEKPTWSGLVSIGAYVMSPEAQTFCPKHRLEMPGLIDLLLKAGCRVALYESHAFWRDIGLPEEYRLANQCPPEFTRTGAGNAAK